MGNDGSRSETRKLKGVDMKKLAWLKRGETVTLSRMAEALEANLPGAVMAVLWVKHTINSEDMDKITAAMKAPKTTKKSKAKKGAE